MRTRSQHSAVCCLAGLLLLAAISVQAGTGEGPERKIRLPKSQGTVYELLEIISRRSGYLFIYENAAINNEQNAGIKKGRYTVEEAVRIVTGNPQLNLRLIGKHILIQQPVLQETGGTPPPGAPKDSAAYFSIEGRLTDRYTGEPVAYATVGVPTNAIGTVSHQDGSFRLRLPVSLEDSRLRISHIGYTAYEAGVLSLQGQPQEIQLEPRVISIQEVVVRLVNPLRLLHEMIEKREQNYAADPVYFTSFYREGVERKKGFINLSEAVFKVYKAPLGNSASDQVKLLKMRRITNEGEKDTLILKMKSGVSSCLMLDVIQNLPDFLLPGNEPQYNYVQSDITEIDNRMAYVVSFEQKKEITEPLYTGELYIDAENSALLAARFEVHPKHIEKATGMFVTRKSRSLRISAQKAVYQISYKPWNGKYYINHIRGDLSFKVRKSNRLFGASTLHTWFEMATCRIENDSVTRFPRNEILQTRTIFADPRFTYYRSFWDNFNIILPEGQLHEAISKINSKIEVEN